MRNDIPDIFRSGSSSVRAMKGIKAGKLQKNRIVNGFCVPSCLQSRLASLAGIVWCVRGSLVYTLLR